MGQNSVRRLAQQVVTHYESESLRVARIIEVQRLAEQLCEKLPSLACALEAAEDDITLLELEVRKKRRDGASASVLAALEEQSGPKHDLVKSMREEISAQSLALSKLQEQEKELLPELYLRAGAPRHRAASAVSESSESMPLCAHHHSWSAIYMHFAVDVSYLPLCCFREKISIVCAFLSFSFTNFLC